MLGLDQSNVIGSIHVSVGTVREEFEITLGVTVLFAPNEIDSSVVELGVIERTVMLLEAGRLVLFS